MKKVLFAMVLLVLSAPKVTAQEAFSENFENVQKEWWTKYKDIWSVSEDKASEGTKSLKFTCSEFPDGQNVQIQNAKVTLKPGTYTISAKVYNETNSSVVGFGITLRKPFIPTNFKINKLEKGKWLELSEEVEVPENAETLIITVSSNPKWGGTGTFYLDDIKITKK